MIYVIISYCTTLCDAYFELKPYHFKNLILACFAAVCLTYSITGPRDITLFGFYVSVMFLFIWLWKKKI